MRRLVGFYRLGTAWTGLGCDDGRTISAEFIGRPTGGHSNVNSRVPAEPRARAIASSHDKVAQHSRLQPIPLVIRQCNGTRSLYSVRVVDRRQPWSRAPHASGSTAASSFPARNVASREEPLVETGRAGQTLAANAPLRLSTVESEQVANITASSMVGAGGAPAPNLITGGSSVSRLTASAPSQHLSPSAQHSPATVEASPAPRAISGHVLSAGRHIAEKSRASIACTRCRRNKTRCRNKNDETPCEACEERGVGNKCDYTNASPAVGNGSFGGNRRESAFGDVEVSVPSMPRQSF
jgi:hypothetical protein